MRTTFTTREISFWSSASDDHGQLEIYQSENKAVQIAVKLYEFTAPGYFVLVYAPEVAEPGKPVQIIMEQVR